MEENIAKWLQGPAAEHPLQRGAREAAGGGAAQVGLVLPGGGAPLPPARGLPCGMGPGLPAGPTVAPLVIPARSTDPGGRAGHGALPLSAASFDSGDGSSLVCPLCHGVSADSPTDADAQSPPTDGSSPTGASSADTESPSPPAGASPGSAGAGVQRRALRKVKRGRSINKVGKWWKMYGYNGPPYCQRCSEVFRDHIIRQISNSANCSRANPCTDCTQVLNYLPHPHEEVWAKMDRTKEARGARAAKQSKKSAAAVGLVQLSESFDGGDPTSGASPKGRASPPGGGGVAAWDPQGMHGQRAMSMDSGFTPAMNGDVAAPAFHGGAGGAVGAGGGGAQLGGGARLMSLDGGSRSIDGGMDQEAIHGRQIGLPGEQGKV